MELEFILNNSLTYLGSAPLRNTFITRNKLVKANTLGTPTVTSQGNASYPILKEKKKKKKKKKNVI